VRKLESVWIGRDSVISDTYFITSECPLKRQWELHQSVGRSSAGRGPVPGALLTDVLPRVGWGAGTVLSCSG
jgi:hypothetical protein